MSDGQYIVKFKKGEDASGFLEELKGKGAKIISDKSDSKVFPHATVQMAQSFAEIKHAAVDYIEPDGEMKTQ